MFSVFFVGYSLFCFVGGYAADRFGAKRVLVAGMSLATFYRISSSARISA